MKKAVQLLNYGEAAYVEQFIQHIQHMVNHEILPGESFQEHFNRLLERYKDAPDSLAAIQEFISDQDESIMCMIPWEAYGFGDPEETGRKWHNFNIFDVKEKPNHG